MQCMLKHLVREELRDQLDRQVLMGHKVRQGLLARQVRRDRQVHKEFRGQLVRAED